VYRTRTVKNSFSASLSKKTPTSIFSQLKKVDVVISEPALDTCLFLIGALEFAGPYTLRQSPVLANRCLVGNHTGVELLCCFDHGNAKQDGSIGSWESGAFLIRYIQNTHLPACPPACSTVCSLFSSFLAFSNGVNKSTETLLCKRVLYSCL
jgi:hypothetical protein